MRQGDRLVQLLPAPLRRLAADLVAVILVVALTILAVFLPVVNETPIRVIIGLPFVLFIPGYAFIAALFPEEGQSPVAEDASDESPPEDEPEATERSGIDGIERVALAFGTSIAIVPLIGLVLNFTPWGIRLVPIVVSVSGFTLVMTAIAAKRRWALPEDEQFSVPYRHWYSAGRAELLEPENRTDAALNVLLVMSILLAVGSVGYAVAVPKQGEAFTEFYLLTEDENGELVAADYPTEFVAGESKSLVVGVSNHEHEQMNYSVVVLIQDVRFENNSTTLLRSNELKRFQTTLPHNETWHLNHTVAPQMTGERLRLTYLLYRGQPPAQPRVANAYRELHLWVNVTAPNSES